MFMGMIKGYIAWQTKVHSKGYIVANTTGAQMMNTAHTRFFFSNSDYLFFYIIRQTTFHKFVHSLLEQSQ